MRRLTVRRSIVVGLGAIAGATLRWAATSVIDPVGDLPVSTLLVNVIGAALLAGLVARPPDLSAVLAARHDETKANLATDLLGAGFCGGLTTMSGFAVDTAALLSAGLLLPAAVYVLLTVVLGIGVGVAVAAVLGSGDPVVDGPAQ